MKYIIGTSQHDCDLKININSRNNDMFYTRVSVDLLTSTKKTIYDLMEKRYVRIYKYKFLHNFMMLVTLLFKTTLFL